MSFPVTIIALVENATPSLSDWQREKLSKFYETREGKFVQITVREQGKPRTISQNRYYWGKVINDIALETGHSPEEIHEIMKWKFLPRRFINFGGKEIEVSKTTTALATHEFEDYLEQIRVFAAAELNLTISLPNE